MAMQVNENGGSRRARAGVAAALGVAALAGIVVVSAADDASSTADCSAVPATRVVADDATPRTATIVNDATYMHMEVPGLDAWANATADSPEGRRAARFVADCPDALADAAAIAGAVPAEARPSVAAARRYALDQWGERALTRLLPVTARRSHVADAPGWSLVLAGPDADSWRYVVVGDDHHVVAWQLKGSDARRLFAPDHGSGA